MIALICVDSQPLFGAVVIICGPVHCHVGVPVAYGSYEELLADPNVDAIYLPLPTALHRKWAPKVAEAGKALLCEKPAARRYGRDSTSKHRLKSHPLFPNKKEPLK